MELLESKERDEFNELSEEELVGVWGGGNNPYCHHRALVQAEQGIRERVIPTVKAQGLPFDNGEFELIEEPIDALWPENDPLHFTADSIQWFESWQDEVENEAKPVAAN